MYKTKLSKPAAHNLRNIHLQREKERRAQKLKINIYADIECIWNDDFNLKNLIILLVRAAAAVKVDKVKGNVEPEIIVIVHLELWT